MNTSFLLTRCIILLPAAMFASGCTVNTNADLGPSIYNPDGGVTGATNGGSSTAGATVPGGGAVGAACSDTMPCRMGLSCTAGTCAPGRMTPLGGACVLNDECLAGLYCNYGKCAAQVTTPDAGTTVGGPAGTPCNVTNRDGDGDCADGLRCAITGLSLSCKGQGAADVMGACKSSNDCLGGLYCAQGKCAPQFPGSIGAAALAWPGETCVPDTGPTKAYFRVPRGTDDGGMSDGDFYRLPFPNDIRRDATGHPNLKGHPTPGAELLGVDVVDAYLRAIEKENDGFGTYATVFFRFSGQIDYASFSAGAGAVQLVDVTPGDPAFGQPRGFNWLSTTARGKYICENWLGVRMATGDPLSPGHTYAAILTTAGMTAAKTPIVRADDFVAMVSPTAPTEQALANAYPLYKPLRDYLSMKAVDPSTILNATVFTVGHPQNAVQALAASVEKMPPPATSKWFKCGSPAPAADPCPDTTGTRGCSATPDPDFDELHALVSLPIFQAGTPPYLDATTDGLDGLITVSGTTATPTRTEDVCLALTVPKGTMPANGWPVVIYAHGTGGSYRSHVTEGGAKTMATGAKAGTTTVPMAVLGIDQVEHGPRRGTSTLAPSNLFYNFLNPHAARDNAVQGAIDQVSLGRLAATFTVDAATSPTGAAIKFDPSGVLFWGHSQGATEGGISLPYSTDIKGVLFSGQGASLIDGLLGKKQPIDIASVVPYALEDFDATGALAGGNMEPVLSLLQTYLDGSDPLNYAAALGATPPMGITGHHVFQVFGQADTFAPPTTEKTYALAAKLGIAPHDSSATAFAIDANHPDPFDLWPESATGVTSNFGGMITGVAREYGPSGYDGHFVVFNNAAAKSDSSSFLAQIAAGMVPKVGSP